MVFLSMARLANRFSHVNTGPDQYWRKAMWLRMSWAFHGRRRNCFGLAMRNVRRALRFATFSRINNTKKRFITNLFETRINAACREHGMEGSLFLQTLLEADVLLNRKVLADLAIYEPRTFKSMVDFVHQRNSHITKHGLPPTSSGSYVTKDVRI